MSLMPGFISSTFSEIEGPFDGSAFGKNEKEMTLFRVATCQGKVRKKQKFLQVRELSGNFEKMSGNFGYLTNVREMSGNFCYDN